MKLKCKHKAYCMFRKAFGYCIKQSEGKCEFYKKIAEQKEKKNEP